MELIKLVSQIAEDAVTAAPAGALKSLVAAVLRRRREVAYDILLREIRQGKLPLLPPDEIVSSIIRYQRAADEGAARLNLRLMAKVLAGQAFLGNLKANEFLYHADILASLRREEITLLATMQRIKRDHERRGEPLEGHEQWPIVVSNLVPIVFADEAAVRAATIACLRTGLLADENTMDNMGCYTTSTLMDELERLAPFEEALSEDSFEQCL